MLQRVSEHEWYCSSPWDRGQHISSSTRSPTCSQWVRGWVIDVGPFMIFGTGGWASADLKTATCNSVTDLCDLSRFNGASRNSGWYAGGGFDYMVYKGPLVDVIFSVEYQHYDVERVRMRSASTRLAILRPGGTRT